MLYHHDNRNYAEAATQAAAECRKRLEAQIAAGAERAAKLLDQIQQEAPIDRVKRGNELASSWHVVPQDNGPALVVLGKELAKAIRVHPHAQQQACQRVKLPWRYLDELCTRGEGWAAELAQKNLRELYQRHPDRMLLRTVPQPIPEVRGIMSDKYRRLDSLPIFNSFAKAAAEVGLVPYDGTHADTRWGVRALLPKVYEPVQNEPMAFGLELRNSDYGNGKLQLSFFVDRLWCTNMATMRDQLSKVHLGARLPEDLRLSQQTYDLDTEAFASAVRDLTLDALSPQAIEATCEVIREADAKELDWTGAKKLLSKLTKTELEKAEDIFEEGINEQVPQKNTRWKVSNVVSWLANSSKIDADRRMELQTIAGEILN